MRRIELRVGITGKQLGDRNKGQALVGFSNDRTDHCGALSGPDKFAFQQGHIALFERGPEGFEIGFIAVR